MYIRLISTVSSIKKVDVNAGEKMMSKGVYHGIKGWAVRSHAIFLMTKELE